MKKIFEFYKKNKAISNIGVVALIISLSYAITYNMPDYFGIEPYYALANNICISYIAALIFYVVQIYIPERRNQKKCLEILKNKFSDMIRFNEVAILLFENHIKIKEKGATVIWNGEGEKIYLKVKSNDERKGPNLSRYLKKEILNFGKTFDVKLKAIKDMAIINYCDYELLNKISELEKQNFYDSLAYVIRYADTDINFKSVINGVKEFKKLNEELKKMCSISENHQLMEVNSMDIAEMDLLFNALLNDSFDIQSHNREVAKINIQEELKKQGVVISKEDLEKICSNVYEHAKQ